MKKIQCALARVQEAFDRVYVDQSEDTLNRLKHRRPQRDGVKVETVRSRLIENSSLHGRTDLRETNSRRRITPLTVLWTN